MSTEEIEGEAARLQCTKHPMPQSEDDLRLSRMFIEMMGCDAARISRPRNRMFLVIGNKKRSEGEWLKRVGNWYEPFAFDYVEEKTVASGDTEDELIASARKYKRLCGMTIVEYLQEETAT